MRKIKLVFHVGYGKTATTSVQNNLAEIPNVLFLGKSIFEGKRVFEGEINDTHYQLFRTYRMEAMMGFANPSRSSADLLNKTADIIVKLILNSSKDIIVLSDECIGDYFNYIGEWNIFLTIAIANTIEEKLHSYNYEIEKVLTFSVRRQLDAIKSVIGYSPTMRIASVDELIDSYSENLNEGILGGYFYYSNIRLFERITGGGWSIKVIPYEFLENSQRLDSYILRIIDEPSLEVNINNHRNNSNSSLNSQSGARDQILRPRNIFSSLAFRFQQEGYSIYSNAKRRGGVITRYFGAGLWFTGKIFSIIGGLKNKLAICFTRGRTSYVACSKQAEKRINQIYRDDNELLKRYVDESELIKFEYIPTPPLKET